MSRYTTSRLLPALLLGAFAVSTQAAQAQPVELYCPKQGASTSFVLIIDYASNTITYYDQFPDGHRSAPIVSTPTITDTTIGWAQSELWPWLDQNEHPVTYSLSRISGQLEYHSINGRGAPDTGLRTCVSAKPQF